jgi:hypothetical protein
MRTAIIVKNRSEAEAIKAALDEPDIRAFVIIAGTLRPLTPRGRKRVLDYVADLSSDPETTAPLMQVFEAAPAHNGKG